MYKKPSRLNHDHRNMRCDNLRCVFNQFWWQVSVMIEINKPKQSDHKQSQKQFMNNKRERYSPDLWSIHRIAKYYSDCHPIIVFAAVNIRHFNLLDCAHRLNTSSMQVHTHRLELVFKYDEGDFRPGPVYKNRLTRHYCTKNDNVIRYRGLAHHHRTRNQNVIRYCVVFKKEKAWRRGGETERPYRIRFCTGE